MLTIILFIVGFFLVIKGADLLVDGGASIAKKLKISDLAVGLTIVAFGTSAPELAVNVFSALKGTTDIAISNALGSNMFNIMLILGISAIIYPLKVTKGTVWKEIPFSLLAAVLIGVMANDIFFDGSTFSALTRIDGIVLLAFFVIFLYYTYGMSKDLSNTGNTEASTIKLMSGLKSTLYILLGMAGLITGGHFVVEGAIFIAKNLGLSDSLIGLTIVAAGTSAPELAASAVAAYKKNADIAVGNCVGSNIFNIFLVLGTTSIIKPLPFSMNNNTDVLVVIYASIILFVSAFVGRKHVIDRWQGVFLVFSYLAYMTFVILREVL